MVRIVDNPRSFDVLVVGMEDSSYSPGGLNRFVDAYSPRLATLANVGVARLMEAPASTSAQVRLAHPEASLLRRLFGCFAVGLSTKARVVDSHFVLYGFAVWLGMRARGRRPTLVAHFHGPWAGESRSAGQRKRVVTAKRHIERAFLRRVEAVFVLSTGFSNLVAEQYGVPRTLIHVVPPGVDVNQFSPRPRDEARRRIGHGHINGPVAISVRRLVPRMGLDDLVRVAGAIPELHVLIAGTGPLSDELTRLAEGLAPGRVHLMGWLPDDAVVDAYAAADVSVVPTKDLEGFGLVALESMSTGTPCVVRPQGGLVDAMGGFRGGQLIAEDMSVQRLVDAIKVSLANPPSSEECRRYARMFTWEDTARKTWQLIWAVALGHG